MIGKYILIFLFLLTVGFAFRASAQTPAEKVVISFPSRSIASIDLFIAQDLGFFREEGLEPAVVQIRGNVAISAALTGQVHVINNVGTVIRAVERGDVPFRVMAVSLKRNLFWLVARPEFGSIRELKGKVLGTTTFGGSQHMAAARLVRKAGLDPDKDLTVVVAGDVPAQLQSLVSGAIQVAALSPPTVILAREKFKMRILGSTVDEYANLQNGIAVTETLLRERRDLVRRILRARTKAARYLWENERGASEVLAKYLNVELPVALESYRLSRAAFTVNGVPTAKEVDEFLKMDAEILKLPKPFSPSRIFDFTVQQSVNQELGIK
ncbi:MAG: ABC transporter substrate-binding protein [Deltaproteobacteria bacterium]|nr:ABC transporter substrate-binding protein [Deltaproteobacteria bacterium]